MLNQLANHLWQSTLFAAVVWLLTLALRRNRARVRHGLWLAASCKFFVPFSLLIALGGQVEWREAPRGGQHRVAIVANQVSEPFAGRAAEIVLPSVLPGKPSPLPAILFGVWTFGFVGVGATWLIRWRRIRAAVHASSPVELDIPIRVVSSQARLEPGVFGVFRPVLVLPEGIAEKLSPEQLAAVIEHELCHVRRRDNLTAAVHMLVEALFWFHPLVWWIEKSMVEERERACDEDVMRLGGSSRVYAQAILKVCELYVESPVACVAGVSGASLKRRIEGIMSNRIARELDAGRKLLVAGVGIIAIAAPLAVGVMNAPPLEAQNAGGAAPGVSATKPPQTVAQATAPPRTAARPQAARSYLPALGTVTAVMVTVRPRIDGQLMSVDFKEGSPVEKGQLLATIDSRAFEGPVAEAQAQLARDQSLLAAARRARAAGLNSPSELADIEGKVQADQSSLQGAQVQLSLTRIVAPISGVAGLSGVAPGSLVRPQDPAGIVTIAQLQPIAVVFGIAQVELPAILARMRAGASLTVEAWSMDNISKLATGHLTAVDNEIDRETGMAKFKAEFDNKDNGLFPNQFVSVRLMVN